MSLYEISVVSSQKSATPGEGISAFYFNSDSVSYNTSKSNRGRINREGILLRWLGSVDYFWLFESWFEPCLG